MQFVTLPYGLTDIGIVYSMYTIVMAHLDYYSFECHLKFKFKWNVMLNWK